MPALVAHCAPRVPLAAFVPPSAADNSFHHRGCFCGCDDSDDE
jgi:hypothetical protein